MPDPSPRSNSHEVKPLVGSSTVNPKNATDKKGIAGSAASWDVRKVLTVVVACLVVVFLFYIGGGGGGGDSDSSHGEIHQTLHNEKKPNDVLPSKNVPGESSAQQNTETMMQNLAKARTNLLSMLRHDYGETNVEALFFETDAASGQRRSRGRSVFRSGDPGSSISWDRTKRKLMMKLLQVMSLEQQQSGGVQFIWATGGHSAAAGHGNLYDESYTAFMARAAKGVFGAVGIELIGRNYAMGGTGSAAELALCSEEVFGLDADVISWDYGMTDGNAAWKQLLYLRRAGMNPNRPITVSLHAGGRSSGSRVRVVDSLEQLGLAALISDEEIHSIVVDAIPDSFGLTDLEISEMPLFVKNFKCSGKIENGDPYCRAQKFNNTICEKRKFQASWHPGWKYQALTGNLMALFLVEVLDDALQEIVKSSVNPASLLQSLKEKEDVDYAKFLNTPIDPSDFQQTLPESEREGFDFELMVKGHTFCHTARVPAEIRHKGILTESSQTGFTTYDKGTALTEAKATPNTGEQLRLVYEPNDRQNCPVPTNMDYKDFFYVNGAEGWKKLVLPNDSELNVYGTGEPLKGLVAICLTLCPWGKCPSGALTREDYFENKFEVSVNGETVETITKFQECDLLKSSTTGYSWQPNADGRFAVGARITDAATPVSYLRISAIIVW